MKNVEDIYPLSPLQENLLVHSLAVPGSGVGFEQKRFTLSGKLDADAFILAWERLLERHTMLRTSFLPDGLERPMQQVRRRLELPIERLDWRGHATEERLGAWLRADRERGFDVRRAPLMRLALIRFGETTWEAVWSYHHLLLDAWSRDTLLRELLAIYDAILQGGSPRLAPARPYRCYIAWLKEQDQAAAEAFWRRHFAGFAGPTPLPCLRPPQSHTGLERVYRAERGRLAERASAALEAFGRKHKLTLGTIVQGAWALLLSGLSGRDDVVYGQTVSGRPAELEGVDTMVGMFINNLPVRVRCQSGERLVPWLAALQESLAEVRRYEYTSAAMAHEWSGSPWNRRLFESLVLFQNTPPTRDLDEWLSARDLRVTMDARMEISYPITCMAHRAQPMPVSISYDAGRLEAADAEGLLKAFTTLLEAFPDGEMKTLGELPLPASAGTAAGPREPGSAARHEPDPPRDPVEEMLVEIWTELTRTPSIGIHDDLFAAGGHSLLATQFVSRVRRAFRVDLPLGRFFAQPTLAALAAHVDAAMKAGEGLEEPPIEPSPRTDDGEPLSYAQERLWFVHQVDPHTHAFNIPRAMRLLGNLDVTALQRALDEVARRHETLRASFDDRQGKPVQRISPRASLSLCHVDLGAVPATAMAAREVRRVLSREARRPFDLKRGPLARALLVRLTSEEHVALLCLHHIISDAWSQSILVRELAALYRAFVAGRSSPLPPLPITYVDFAKWQRRWLEGEVYDRQLAYWRERLQGAPSSPLPPSDRPRPETQTFRGAFLTVPLDRDLETELRRLGGREGTTLFMTLLGAFGALLTRLTGQEDVVLGTDVANRNRLEVEGLIGFFVNNLVLRTDLSGNPTFREILERVRETTLGAYAHQDFPFDRLVQALKPRRTLSRVPLFQVLFVMQNVPAPTLDLSGLTLQPADFDFGMSKFDFGLFITERDGLAAHWHYSTDLYDASTIERLSRDYMTLLKDVCQRPDTRLSHLALASSRERRASKIAKLRQRKLVGISG